MRVFVRVCVSLWVWEAWDVQVLIIYCMFALHSSACEMGGKMPQGGRKGYVAGGGAWHCTGIWRVATAALMRHLHISLAKPALGRPHDKRSQRMQQFCSATLLLMQIKVAKDDWKVHTSASVCVCERQIFEPCVTVCVLWSWPGLHNLFAAVVLANRPWQPAQWAALQQQCGEYEIACTILNIHSTI